MTQAYWSLLHLLALLAQSPAFAYLCAYRQRCQIYMSEPLFPYCLHKANDAGYVRQRGERRSLPIRTHPCPLTASRSTTTQALRVNVFNGDTSPSPLSTRCDKRHSDTGCTIMCQRCKLRSLPTPPRGLCPLAASRGTMAQAMRVNVFNGDTSPFPLSARCVKRNDDASCVTLWQECPSTSPHSLVHDSSGQQQSIVAGPSAPSACGDRK